MVSSPHESSETRVDEETGFGAEVGAEVELVVEAVVEVVDGAVVLVARFDGSSSVIPNFLACLLVWV